MPFPIITFVCEESKEQKVADLSSYSLPEQDTCEQHKGTTSYYTHTINAYKSNQVNNVKETAFVKSSSYTKKCTMLSFEVGHRPGYLL